MENRTPFDLNEAIRRWQDNVGASPALDADDLEELDSHLRASVQKLQADGLSAEEAFLAATRRLGERGALEREFDKVHSRERIRILLMCLIVVIGSIIGKHFGFRSGMVVTIVLLPALLGVRLLSKRV